ncbi:negative cofactor 2 transcription regulator complex subunit [Starmerella bacillaris]|uniref:Negative cofactor 2 transcription regulator complex subunit n=1 Tax=Starmerella bacillaris TaxID=1247836 RepID=A0AAV5RGK2_STABA|nr:negative cofactor 2 transcription regulator complex subunit [Starmerella bacillaris]
MEGGSDDLSLPKATVQKIITEILPKDLSYSREARDALIECCVMFIMILSQVSNETAEHETKKTITSEHVIEALRQLDFPEYIEPIKRVVAEHKEGQKLRERKVTKLELTGRTEAELLEEQERLFASSRQRLLGNPDDHAA